MRFLFVDEVTASTGNRISGRRQYLASEPMQYPGPTGAPVVAPGAVSEAIGQLASWLCLARNGFAARPVFLFADTMTMTASVRPGDDVELHAEIHEMDHESFRFSGDARVGGEQVQTIRDCSGYFMPLAELEDPAVTRARHAALIGGGLTLAGAASAPYPFETLAGKAVALEPGVAVCTRKTFDPAEPFYPDHFPRFPVTPIVILNEMIGVATAKLVGLDSARRLVVRSAKDLKIRAFVRPGDTCETVVRATAMAEEGGVKRLTTTAEILKDGRRILRGTFAYDVVG